MPYLSPDERKATDRQSPGKLNYDITMRCLDYLEFKGETYTHHNDILGVLEAVKQEWYRRMVVPYEEKKLAENGDVYPK